MTPGETGELFDELSGHVCPECDGVLHEGTKHICIKNETPTNSCGGYEFGTGDTAGGSGTLCACGVWYPFGQEHWCYLNPKPLTVDVSTNGYNCVFCGMWVQAYEHHFCLHTRGNDYAEINDRLVRIEENQQKLAKGIVRILKKLDGWKFGSAEDFLNDIMGPADE